MNIFEQETQPVSAIHRSHTTGYVKSNTRSHVAVRSGTSVKIDGKQRADIQRRPSSAQFQYIASWMRVSPVIRRMSKQLWRRRVPQLSQMSMVECGLACLAMIFSYYGRSTSISELRTRCGVGRDGLSALNLVRVARQYGMKVRAMSLQQHDLSTMRLPAIVHWEFNHFLVVESWSRGSVRVVDPAGGRRRLTPAEFDAGFTGVVILLEPGASFQRCKGSSRSSIRHYLAQYVRLAPMVLVQVVCLSLLIQGFGLLLPLTTRFIIDQVLPFKLSGVMGMLGLGMVMLVLSQGVTTLLREWLLVYLRARIDMHMMRGFFEHLLKLPYKFFQQHSNGDLLARMSSNTIIRDTFSNHIISTLLDSSMVTLYLGVLLWQSLPFGVLAACIGLLQVILMLSTNGTTRDLASQELAAQGKSQGYMSEALVGIASLKAAGAEDRALERWSRLFFEQLNISVRRSYFSGLVSVAMVMLRSLSPLALLWLGATQVLNGSLTMGTMFALNALAAAFLAPLGSLVSTGQQLQLVRAHFERLADVTLAEPEQKERTKRQATPRLTGCIHLEHVSFQYDPNTRKVLDAINLHIEAGQKVALVGRTGCGKSTLGKLLLGLYTPTEGSISYDGIPLSLLDYREVRRQFGVVMQDSSIFSGSILHNLRLNNPNLSLERVVQSAKIAAVHKDIVDMPMGYETFVSEGGSALSGGQRQRLSIARAIAHDPTILLLDEATSNLDVLTEQKVEEHLRSLACTQIIIAHRLSTIRNADLIIVLDHGTIVEQGSHDELMRHNGYYMQLMRCQMENDKPGLRRTVLV
ncbi:MAG TPA: peptidase domain-containing ABC transporter [Ktedonosporobacter sp.]|nr:peptidase domain-containing ABC transporter [Ktedonosporobacter sp.]